jgi:hypothetical protein
MHKILLAATSAAMFPAGAHAVLLYVEYEGTVSAVEENPCLCSLGYQVGDPVKGFLKIDADLAPSDQTEPNNSPLAGFYGLYGGIGQLGQTSPDFITGYTPRTPGLAVSDWLEVLDDEGFGPFDAYRLEDAEGYGTSRHVSLLLYARDLPADYISGDSIVQSFDAVPSRDGSVLTATLNGGFFDGTRRLFDGVTVALSRLTVTPGHCSR